MVNVSQNTNIPDVGSVFLEMNHLMQTVEHHGYLFPVTEAAAPPAQLLLSGRSQPHQKLPKRKDLCGFRTPARQGAGPTDARPFTRVSLTPPEAGAGSVTRHSSVALTTAGAVGVEKPQVLRQGGGRHGSQEHEELVSVSDLYHQAC